jgi:excisionase family DNA binding protein
VLPPIKQPSCNKRNIPLDSRFGNLHHERVRSFLSASEVGRLVGVNRATITRWIKKGIIKGAVRPAGSQKWRIPLTAYETLVKPK